MCTLNGLDHSLNVGLNDGLDKDLFFRNPAFLS